MERFPSTGLDHLDEMLRHLQYGDNVVWQVDNISHYKEFVAPYVSRAIQEKRKLVYIRFAQHDPLVKPQEGVSIVELDADVGFETFSTNVHSIISEQGLGAYYVFDCLSDLLSAWATDLMVGNFFCVTCPYLYELDTIAFFGILRDYHSYHTIARIRETTQLLLDLYRLEGAYYVHPLKVENRYSPTMFLPHRDEKNRFVPIMNSVDAARLFSYISDKGRRQVRRKLDYWDRLFMNAEELSSRARSHEEQEPAIEQICRIMIGRDKRMLDLVKRHFSLQDLLDIRARLIGTGYIGGKAVGMLLARKILLEDSSFDWMSRLEKHDSFYIGSDIFHTYVVQNGLWKMRMEQKTKEGYFARAPNLAEGLLKGRFPSDIREQFEEMVEYFGQSPIIVRSSSLLEDSYGNAFAGKYESIFLVNQGSLEERYKAFENAVRTIYASAMNEDALSYRLQRGLDRLDEQMALLVQRVSGRYHQNYFYPDIAGVGVSYNTFVWNQKIDPEAGMLRLVLGLGTRAVDRVEHDYPRLVALGAPLSRPFSGPDNLRKFSQHYMDVLNIESNEQEAISVKRVIGKEDGIYTELFASRDDEADTRMKQLGIAGEPLWVLTFDALLEKTDLVPTIRRLLSTLQRNYEYPVDVELTINFPRDGAPQINLLQCRPLQTRGLGSQVRIPAVPSENVVFKTQGGFMGGNISETIQQVIYVDPVGYVGLPIQDKHAIARLIGRLNRMIGEDRQPATLLMGPGRWGTTTPSLGIPVRFSEINRVSALCEMSYPEGNLMPELSYGSHFFQDLVETEIFYVALFLDKEGTVVKMDRLRQMRNNLETLAPEAQKYVPIVKVISTANPPLQIVADVLQQQMICFFGSSE
ncbi:MAG: hypothetical protein JW828_02915 [Sedimentisphaerales bacterium]|nr:hypothetical protein [Sedimentisphaerales bacterium]